MRGRSIALAVGAAGVLAGGVWLAFAVRAGSEPVTPAPAPKPAPTAASPVEREAPPVRAGSAERVVPTPTESKQRAPIPDGGFAAWTGKEGLAPGEIEDQAKAAGLRVPLALELRRSTLLEERTADNVFLGELLGSPPTGYMLATIGTQAKVLRNMAATMQVEYRNGKVDDGEALRLTRESQATYRAAYKRVTGLSDEQFERFFARDRPLP
jgi:hypothetical protein